MSRPLAVVIRLSALGDVLLAAPVFAALSRTHEVCVVTERPYAPLVARLAGVSEALVLARADGVKGAWRLGRELAARRPELVVDLQNKARSAVLARASGARETRTLSRRTWAQALGAAFGRDTVLADTHQVDRYLSMVPGATFSQLGPLSLDAAWVAEAASLFDRMGWAPDARPYAVAPAATHATKGWPVERFAEWVRADAPAGAPLLLVAGPADGGAVGRFRAALGDRPLLDASSASLGTLSALIARAQVLVGNDSGPIHLATMLGVPTVALFGPTSHVRWGPPPGHGARHRVARLDLACSPCSNHGGRACPEGHHRCMNELGVDAVRSQLASLVVKES
jgi:ADP-heptose:LPS heptosyltransferase